MFLTGNLTTRMKLPRAPVEFSDNLRKLANTASFPLQTATRTTTPSPADKTAQPPPSRTTTDTDSSDGRRGPDSAATAATTILAAVQDEEANGAYATFILPGDYRHKLTGTKWNGLLAFHPATRRNDDHESATDRQRPQGGQPNRSTSESSGPANLIPLQAPQGHTHFTIPNPGPNRRRSLVNLIKLLGLDESFIQTATLTFHIIRNIGHWVAYLVRYGLRFTSVFGNAKPIQSLRRILQHLANLPLIVRLQDEEGDAVDGREPQQLWRGHCNPNDEDVSTAASRVGEKPERAARPQTPV